MARLFVVPIDLSNLEILNVRAQILSGSDPTGLEAKFYYNSTSKTFKFHNSTDWINLGRLDQISAPTASVNLNSQKIINLLDPTDPQDAATKFYVDNLQANTSVKNPVRAATVGTNITLAGGAPNTLDGVSLAANDRILVKDQSTGSQNGLYFVQTLGSGANGTWVRTLDADVSADVVTGLQVFVSEGTVNADSEWVLSTNAPITLDTTTLTFTRPGASGGNVALGPLSLRFATGTGNTAIGTSAGDVISTGTNNTVVGDNAGGAQTTSSGLTAVGKDAAVLNTAANTTAVGLSALAANTSGTGSTAVGAQALLLSTGNNNTAVGTNAADAITSGTDTVAIGTNALGLATGSGNTAVGSQASDAITSGTNTTAVGFNALGANTASDSTAVGKDAMLLNSSSTGNTAVGARALDAVVASGNNNTAVGTDALGATTAGSNTGVGFGALLLNSSGTQNTAVGANAADASTTVSNVTAVGFNALTANTAADSTAVGSTALAALTSGTGNTAVGARALDAVTTTTNNTALGTDAGGAHTGANATFVGFNAGLLTTGNQNTAIGSTALDANVGGTNSTAVGFDALGLSTGNQNTALGSTAGNTNTTGTNNTFLGYNADTNSASGTNRTAVGANASVTVDNTVQLGDGSVTNVNTAGTYTGTQFISTISTGTAPLTVASTTKVTNLNADLLDDLNTAVAGTVNTVVIRDAAGRTQMVDPVAAQDVATKNYVDSVATGLDVKASVRAATTAAGTLATDFENNDIIDGVTLATGNRILIKNQATASENGIYTVNASGAPTRATDADTSAEVTAGMFTFVSEGTVNADTGWILSTDDAITLGSTNLTFTQFSSAGIVLGGAGLLKTGNTLDIVAADGSITVNADSITVGLVPISKGGTNGTTAQAARTNLVVPSFFAASHGDGAATSYNIDHNLGTLDVLVNVFRNSDGVEIMPDITRSTTNRVIVGYAVAPTSNQFRAVVHGGV